MNPLFPCDHGAATHSCIMHDTGRGTLCKNATFWIFGINFPQRGIPLKRIFTQFGVGETVPGPHPHAKFQYCGFKNVGFKPRKLPKLLIFGINLPPRGIYPQWRRQKFLPAGALQSLTGHTSWDRDRDRAYIPGSFSNQCFGFQSLPPIQHAFFVGCADRLTLWGALWLIYDLQNFQLTSNRKKSMMHQQQISSRNSVGVINTGGV